MAYLLSCSAWTARFRFSATVRCLNRLVIWKVRASPSAARRNGGVRVTSWPKSRMRPDVGVSCPATRLNRVVLPAPLGPIRARRSPGCMLKDTSRTAFSPPNCIETWSVTSGSMRAYHRLGLHVHDLGRFLRCERDEPPGGASATDAGEHFA